MITPPITKTKSLGEVRGEKFFYRLVMIGIQLVFSQNVLRNCPSFFSGKYRNYSCTNTRIIVNNIKHFFSIVPKVLFHKSVLGNAPKSREDSNTRQR